MGIGAEDLVVGEIIETVKILVTLVAVVMVVVMPLVALHGPFAVKV